MSVLPAPAVIDGVETATALIGVELGCTEYIPISQARVDRFADATDDHQWIHVDPQRAATGPFGGPIAHGYLTLSLAPFLLSKLVRFEGFRTAVNYGCEKVRFIAPVRVGTGLRCRARLDRVRELEGGLQTELTLTFEAEGALKPSCVATIVLRHYR